MTDVSGAAVNAMGHPSLQSSCPSLHLALCGCHWQTAEKKGSRRSLQCRTHLRCPSSSRTSGSASTMGSTLHTGNAQESRQLGRVRKLGRSLAELGPACPKTSADKGRPHHALGLAPSSLAVSSRYRGAAASSQLHRLRSGEMNVQGNAQRPTDRVLSSLQHQPGRLRC